MTWFCGVSSGPKPQSGMPRLGRRKTYKSAIAVGQGWPTAYSRPSWSGSAG
jgi:hypothetical protein